MTIYFTEKTFTNEITDHLRKLYPRGERGVNTFTVTRANTIDSHLLIEYFDCAAAKDHDDLYKVFITLPAYLENKIPSWDVRSDNEMWVNPKGARGKTIYGKEVFIVEFNLYIDKTNFDKDPANNNISIEEALIREFIEARHALIDGNDEPIDIFKAIYARQGTKIPKSHVGKYLASILKQP